MLPGLAELARWYAEGKIKPGDRPAAADERVARGYARMGQPQGARQRCSSTQSLVASPRRNGFSVRARRTLWTNFLQK
jgi:hypothetical protein